MRNHQEDNKTSPGFFYTVCQSVEGRLLGPHGHLYRLLIAVAVILIIMSLLHPGKFLSQRNVSSMCFQFPELGIFALAIMFSLVSGGIDLSIISIANLGGILSALLLTRAGDGMAPTLLVILAVLTTLAVGILCGLFNGWLIACLGITPILATLGTMQLFMGLCLVITKGPAVYGYPDLFLHIGNGTVGPVPIPLLVFLAIALVAAVILNRTKFGIHLVLLGTNETAARFSGIPYKAILIKTYMLSGLLAGIAGLLMIARTNSAKADYGTSYLLQAVLIAILGGVNPNGGFGTVTGIFMAVLSLQFLSSGFNMLRLNNFTKEFAWGAFLLAVMTLNILCHHIVSRPRKHLFHWRRI